MILPAPTEPMTPEGWKVLGCLVVIVVALFLAGSVYVCVRTGFRNPTALGLLGSAVFMAMLVGAGWHVIRRWVG